MARRLSSRLAQLRRAKVMARGSLVAASMLAGRYWQQMKDRQRAGRC